MRYLRITHLFRITKYLSLGVLMTTFSSGYVVGGSGSFLDKLFHTNPAKDATEPSIGKESPAATQPQVANKRIPKSQAQVKFSFAPIVNRAKPAVVSIYALQVREKQIRHPLFDEQFFSFFFGRPDFEGIPRREVERSLGSGVIIDPEGIIITCHHVVDDAKVIQVKLDDNRTFEAKVVVDDPRKDLAVIKIIHHDKNKPSLPFIPLGDVHNAEVGDPVIAIGNPFGVGMTVTNGIVSALARSFNGQILLQTDTPINPGNSGGALVDMDGNLIAVPNVILSRTGASHGIGFAIPSTMIRPLLVAAKKGDGKILYPWDGIKLKTMTAEEAESFGLDRPMGVMVASIHPQSPAIKAGLKPGDIIIKVNNNPLQSIEDYQVAVQETDIGTLIYLTVLRQGHQKAIQFNIIAPPESPYPEVMILAKQGPFAGVKVANLSPALIQQYNFPDSYNEGVVIIDVPSRGFGFVGIQPGDIIAEVNDKKITDLKQLQQLLNEALYKLTIRRGDSVRIIQMR